MARSDRPISAADRRVRLRRAIAAARHASAPLAEALYVGGWPARFARACGLQRPVTVVEHMVARALDPSSVPPLRLAFASDFHAGATTHPAALQAACVALAELRADALLLGGDFVSLHARHIDTLAPLLGQIPAPLGRYAVLGNHDRWADAARIVRLLEAAGVQVLINRAQRLAAPFAQVAICGLDDADTGAPDAEQALAGADGVRIVLMHSPDGLRNLAQHRFDLALCGHTHGGQVALRSGRPLLLPGGPLCRRYPAGRFELGDAVSPQTLIVSRGVGYSTIPLRVHAPPDILAIRVAASEAGA